MPTDHASDASTGLDVEALSDQIGHSLFGTEESDTTATAEAIEDPSSASVPPPQTAAPLPDEDRAPETWPKEMHPHWAKTPAEVRTYWRTREKQMHDGLAQYKQRAAYGTALHDVLSPISADLRAAGISEAEMVGRLLTAQRRLTVGSDADRRAAYDELGRNLGFLQQQAQAQGQAPVAPEVRLLQDKLARVESLMAADQQHRMSQIKEVATKDVEAFASDSKAHPHFDEVADDIVRFIQQGFKLDEAYEKAVWANPVTRAKEIARVQTEHEGKLKENARLEALPKKRASSVNVNSKEMRMAPTEPVGSLEDTLRYTLRSIKERGTT